MSRSGVKRAGAWLVFVPVVIVLVGVIQAQTRQSSAVADHEKRITKTEEAVKIDHDAVTRIDAAVSRMEKQVDKIADHLLTQQDQ